MNDPWPIIDNISSSENVIPYFNDTSETIKQHYDGKIESKISEIKYVLEGVRKAVSMLNDISILTAPPANDPKYKEVEDIEKGRKAAFVKSKDFKYEIYNDHLYYKLFTINIPEFYPVTIKVSPGILTREEKEISISNLEELKSVFSDIVNSNKVRSIIKKMLL